MWFECKVRYEKMMENGLEKKVTEPYLIDALSFTEAEARTIEEMTPFIRGEFAVKAVRETPYAEVVLAADESADRWYRVKSNYITLDEKNGAEKKTSVNTLVCASDLRDAIKRYDEHMKGTMADYQIVQVTETMIMDVYLYTNEEKAEV